jgi:hypothetical protein
LVQMLSSTLTAYRTAQRHRRGLAARWQWGVRIGDPPEAVDDDIAACVVRERAAQWRRNFRRRRQRFRALYVTGLMALYRTPANPVALADRAQRDVPAVTAASIRTRLACPQIVQGRPGSGTARRIRRTYAPSSCCTRRMAESDPKLCHGSRAAEARSQLSALRLSRCCASVSASRARLRVTDAQTPLRTPPSAWERTTGRSPPAPTR